MKNITKWGALALLTMPLVSCSDFLDTEQPGATGVENFYKTDEEALQALMAIYDKMQDDNLSMFEYKNELSDDAQAGGGSSSDNAQGRQLDEFRIAASNTKLQDMYEHYYQTIYAANMLLSKVADDTSAKRLYRAEAKALRAYSYFELVTLWGPVPLVLTPLEAGDYNQPTTPEADIYAQIETDLKEAMADLPLKSQQPAADKGRVSRGTAQAWLGKTQLYEASPGILGKTEKYAEAAQNLTAVINSGEYDLYPDYLQITRAASEFGVESLFEIAYVGNLSYQLEACYIHAYCAPRSEWFGSKSKGESGISTTGWGWVNPENSGLRECYIAEGDDIRLQGNVLNEADYERFYGVKDVMHRESDGSMPFGCDGLIRMKYAAYVDTEIAEGNDSYHTMGSTNFRILRYADVLLMAAEAIVGSNGNQTDADAYVNKVRQRVGLGTKTGVTLADIKLERRMELAFEFVRFQDLIRWNDAESVLKDAGKKVSMGTYTNGKEDFISPENAGFKKYNRYMPYPEAEISVNKKIQQHEGY